MAGFHHQVVIIGSGPGGEGAAMTLAKAGRQVLVVERYVEVGGGCTHWGTIPSKALRHAMQEYARWRHNPLVRDLHRGFTPPFGDLIRTATTVIERQVDLRQGFYERNRVEVLHGEARFVEPQTIEVRKPDGATEQISADHFLLATGSRPYRPPDVDFSDAHIFDADTILHMAESPRSLLVYGAGVVGCEYASMFRNLDIKVTLINTRDRLLSFLDDEIGDALAYHLRDLGVLIRHGEEYSQVETRSDGTVAMHLKSGKVVTGDALLWANGRTGNSRDLGLEVLGIAADERGNLKVNDNYQTEQPHIYAVGDLIGFPAMASAAYDQGRLAAQHIATGVCDRRLTPFMPMGIYTSPEVSYVGRTEAELTRHQVPYEVGHAFFKSLAHAQITGHTVGMLKLLFHRETLALLGIHCFGHGAAELVHIGQAIMAQPGEGNTVKYFADTTFNYPTMAEAYRVAAINGLNRLR